MSADMALLTQACLPLLGHADIAAAIKRAQMADKSSSGSTSMAVLNSAPAEVTDAPAEVTDALAGDACSASTQAKPVQKRGKPRRV